MAENKQKYDLDEIRDTIDFSISPIVRLIYRIREAREIRTMLQSRDVETLVDLAGYERVSRSALRTLASSGSDRVREAVLYSSRTNGRIRDIVRKVDDDRVNDLVGQICENTLKVARMDETVKYERIKNAVFDKLANSTPETVRIRLASDIPLCGRMEELLVRDSSPRVRLALACNPLASQNTLKCLCYDRNDLVREAVARNISAGMDVLKRIAANGGESADTVSLAAGRIAEMEVLQDVQKEVKRQPFVPRAMFSSTERKAIVGDEFRSALIEWSGAAHRSSAPAQDIHGHLIDGVNGLTANMLLKTNPSWLPVFITKDEMKELGLQLYAPAKPIRIVGSENSVSGNITYRSMYNISDTNMDRVMPETLAELRRSFEQMTDDCRRVNPNVMRYPIVARRLLRGTIDSRTCTHEDVTETISVAYINTCYNRPILPVPEMDKTHVPTGEDAYELRRVCDNAIRELNEKFDMTPGDGIDIRKVSENVRQRMERATHEAVAVRRNEQTHRAGNHISRR